MTVASGDVVDRIRAAAASAIDAHNGGRAAAGDPAIDSRAERALAAEVIALELRRVAEEALASGAAPMAATAEDQVATATLDAMFGAGALSPYLRDDRIENVDINGFDAVWVTTADGTKYRGEPVAASDGELVELVKRLAARAGRSERRFDDAEPILNLRLPDGSRLHAIYGVTARPHVSLRRHRHTNVTLADLAELGTVDDTLVAFLSAAVAARFNVVIGGVTNSGKTTLLRALVAEIDADERILVVEDEGELNLAGQPGGHLDVLEAEKREANIEGHGQIGLDRLVRETLRQNGDRAIVGEVRGVEVVPMLENMSHIDGTFCTIHAHSSAGIFRKIQMYAAKPPAAYRPDVAAMFIADSIDLVVQLALDRATNRRYVTSIREVVGSQGETVVSNETFGPGPDGAARPYVALTAGRAARLAAHGYTTHQCEPAQ